MARLMSTKQRFQDQGWWIIGGGVAVAAGVFGPWSRPPGALQLHHSWAGVSTWHGRATLVLGILLIVLGLLITLRKPRPNDLYYRPLAGATVLFSILAIFLVIHYASVLANTRQEVGGAAVIDVVEVHTGWGEGLSLLGLAAALLGGVWTWNKGHRKWRQSQQELGTASPYG